MSVPAKINIFDFVDYRFFLRDFYEFRKKTSRGFTYRSFARDAGVSPSLLKDILSGRQNLSIAVMRKYAGAMRLSEKETAYFEALVAFNNSKTNPEKNRAFGEMVALRGRSAIKFLDVKQYEFFSKWYYPVVREMVTHRGFGDDAEAIARAVSPGISAAKVRRAIFLLKELGLIYRDDGGVWRSSDKVISSEYEIRSVALKNYHNEMLALARNALETFPSEKREFQGLTLSASRAAYERLKGRVRTFTDEVLGAVAAEKDDAETVFQLNINMFPFTDEEVGK